MIGWEVAAWIAVLLGALGGAVALLIRRRNMRRWLPAYLRQWGRMRTPRLDKEIHVILCVADHYEPKAGRASVETGRRRVAAWTETYPRQFRRFRDSDGRTPRHTFFFPIEEYEPDYLDRLAGLCRAGFGEVEVHLHHDGDSADALRDKLLKFKELLSARHGLLSRHRESGTIMYGFIHGNWALCNSRPDGRLCGVNNEIAVLLETGCYADFTYPSAPDATQPPIINRIYYARNRPGESCSHYHEAPGGANSLLMVQGPLMLTWRRRKWGLIPRIENGCLQSSQAPSLHRLWTWLQARVQVPQRPDWYFVKLHAHGAVEHDHESLLGDSMVRFHEDLAQTARSNPNFHYHYVTAREMANLIRAAHAGYQGPIVGALDWEVISNVGKEALRAV